MPVKIYLSASNQTANPCKSGDSEAKHCYLYVQKLASILLRCGFDVLLCDYCQGIREMIAQSNTWGADLHLVNHTNASNGSARGSNIFISGKWTQTQKLAETIKKYRELVYDAGVSIRTNNSWYEMLNAKAFCVYEELVFHDNPSDAAWFHNNMDSLAQATAKALCEHYGYSFKDSSTPSAGDSSDNNSSSSGDTVYTVQKGDTLYAIAQKYGTSCQALAHYNGICDPNRIYSGQKIIIPSSASAESSSSSSIQVGDSVRVLQGAYTYDGKTRLASFVFHQTFDVLEVAGDRVVIGLNGSVTAALNSSVLVRQ